MSQDPASSEAFDFTVDAAATESVDPQKSSYSLLLLFYITTVAAILAAFCRLAFAGTTWSAKVYGIGYAVTGGLSILMAMLLGYWIGRTWISVLLGLLAGSICGLVALLMVLVQPSHYGSASMILCGGCWILSVIAIVGNRWQRQ